MAPAPTSLFDAEAISPLSGSPLNVVEAEASSFSSEVGVRIAVDRAGALPGLDPAAFDVMVTTRPGPPVPWVGVAPGRLAAQLDTASGMAARNPVATAVLSRVLRIGEQLDFEAALEMESLAYSVLLGGAEFANWLACSPRGSSGEQSASPVRYEREGSCVTLTLASPDNRNAMTAAMRDALFESLANVLEDQSGPSLNLRADGRCFSTGGDLAEFGSARDLARAHIIRTQRSCAALLHRLGDRATVYLHGACIGSGIEVPAAAFRRIGAPDTIIQLPELSMGLIPGAGGTVSLARAIGRHRLMWLVLTAQRLGAKQALDWGLLHAIEP
ncbi:enoyl-CoA hydratase/isomerase family protein [Novosphingobium sp.]|uniref:enoyl-CoA hydratase/isomerase family protein n=1 Tax=Novosphingobium sp. TaxID=1874826 RepID=UPI0025D94332|nr:enoyl-CoA hydratase/isomerase family protein [Novosphingobium sp.]